MSKRTIVTAAAAAIACLTSCSSVDLAETGESFDSCRAGCEKRLSDINFPVMCLLFNAGAMSQFQFALDRSDEIGNTIEVLHGGCGCLTAEISPTGRLTKVNVAYSNRYDAAALFSEELRYLQIGKPVESCLVGSVVPLVFGTSSPTAAEDFPRYHTVHPIYKTVAEAGLPERPFIVARDMVVWTGLNHRFGILQAGKDRYLAESDERCLPNDSATGFSYDGLVLEGDEVAPDEVLIDDCPLSTFYQIDAAQEEAIKRVVAEAAE